MTHYGVCESCGRPVVTPQTPAFPVVGWEVARSGGGANSIRQRVRIPNRVRHNTCLPPTSEALFGAHEQPQLFGPDSEHR